MLARDLISEVVPSLRTSDTGLDALNWMEVFRVSHLPIVNNQQFLGLISDTDIFDQNQADQPIGNHPLSLVAPFVTAEQHIYDVVEVASRLKLTTIPVLDEHNEYFGLITLATLCWNFNKLIASSTPGGMITLEVKPRDYSLTEIARIVEENDAKVLSLYVTQDDPDDWFKIVLKLNVVELSRMTQSFERFGYQLSVIQSDDRVIDDRIRSNFESFMRYLNP